MSKVLQVKAFPGVLNLIQCTFRNIFVQAGFLQPISAVNKIPLSTHLLKVSYIHRATRGVVLTVVLRDSILRFVPWSAVSYTAMSSTGVIEVLPHGLCTFFMRL